MQLILVRHGLPIRIEPGSLPAGVAADPGLTDQGRRQARVTGEFLGAESVEAVYASPVRRAWETGEVIAASLGLMARECAGVAEWDAGATSYIPVEERVAADDEMWRALRSGQLPDQDFDGEEFRRLVVDTVGAIADARDATGSRGAVVVVTHAGVINAYVGHLLDRRDPFWLPLPMAPGYCSVTRIAMVAGAASAQVVSVNETAHVRDLLSSSVPGTLMPH
jgi:probable phosphoglycerate mutase